MSFSTTTKTAIVLQEQQVRNYQSDPRPPPFLFFDNASWDEASSSKPHKPLSAYNLFFLVERQRILAGGINHPPAAILSQEIIQVSKTHRRKKARSEKRLHRKTHGKIGFCQLAEVVAYRWKHLDEFSKQFVRDHAKVEKMEHDILMHLWEANHKQIAVIVPAPTGGGVHGKQHVYIPNKNRKEKMARISHYPQEKDTVVAFPRKTKDAVSLRANILVKNVQQSSSFENMMEQSMNKREQGIKHQSTDNSSKIQHELQQMLVQERITPHVLPVMPNSGIMTQKESFLGAANGLSHCCHLQELEQEKNHPGVVSNATLPFICVPDVTVFHRTSLNNPLLWNPTTTDKISMQREFPQRSSSSASTTIFCAAPILTDTSTTKEEENCIELLFDPFMMEAEELDPYFLI